LQPLFRDVTDLLRRWQEEIDALPRKEVLAFGIRASPAEGAGQQTAITGGWRAWPPSSRVPTAIAGHLRYDFGEYAGRLKMALRLILSLWRDRESRSMRRALTGFRPRPQRLDYPLSTASRALTRMSLESTAAAVLKRSGLKTILALPGPPLPKIAGCFAFWGWLRLGTPIWW